jgi:hypothetical protein
MSEEHILVETLSKLSLELKNESIIDKLHKTICSIENENVVLLKDKKVLQWIYEDFSFLSLEKKKEKEMEDKWGQNTLRIKRPDLKLDKQWTNKFGEHLVQEFYQLKNFDINKPMKKENLEPDWETDKEMIEVKTGTYYTTGTAHEKIPGVPFKYSKVPYLYGKSLKIIVIGGAENFCREKGGILEGKYQCENKLKFLKFYKDMGFEFIAFSELLKTLL